MSKLFIKHPKYKRIESKVQRDEIISEIVSGLLIPFIQRMMLSHSTSNFTHYVDYSVVRELEFKDSFGDLDIIVKRNYDDVAQKFYSFVTDELYRHSDLNSDTMQFTRTTDFNLNAGVLSFLYHRNENDAYHIDFIYAGDDLEFKNKIAYFQNNIVSNFLGQFLNAYDIRVGWNGAFKTYIDSRGNKQYVLLEYDMNKFYQDYFNLDISTLRFESKQELFDFLVNVPFFCGKEKYSKVHSSDKKRSVKLHGLLNETFNYLSNLPDEYNETSFEMVLKPEHQKLVDEHMIKHEDDLRLRSKVKDSVEDFLAKNNITLDADRQEVYQYLRPMMESFILKSEGKEYKHPKSFGVVRG